MKKVLLIAIAVLVFLAIFAGCNDATEQTEQEETGDAVTETEESAATDVDDGDDVEKETVAEGYINLYWDYLNTNRDGFTMPYRMGNYLETNLIWDTLVRIDFESDEIVYRIAEEITANEDYTVYTVKLRDDVVWHDGTGLTAEDVVFSYTGAVCANPSSASRLSSIVGFEEASTGESNTLEGVYAVDDYTVVFELSESVPGALSATKECIFSAGTFSILPSHLFEGIEWVDLETADYWQNPIGSGPYMIDQTAYPEYYTLVINEDFYGETPGVENIKLTGYIDQESAYAAAMSGDLDLFRNIAYEDAENIVAENSDCEVAVFNAGYVRFFSFNVREDAEDNFLQDVNIRKAFSLLIDRQALVDYFGAYTSVATTFTNNSGYNDDIPVWERDLEKAEQLLIDAGYDFSDTVQILAYYTDQATIDVMDIVVANFAEIGISAEYTIEGTDPNTLWEEGGTYDLYYVGLGGANTASYEDMTTRDRYFDGFEETKREEYTKLIAEYKATLDNSERMRISDELQLMFVDDLYFMPLYFMNTVYLVNSSHLVGYSGQSTDYEVDGYIAFEDWSYGGE